MVYKKFASQDQLCETSIENLKQLLEEKMSQELRLTEEQMILVESVISESIVDIRDFHQGLMEEMLKPLLNIINEQNAKLLEKESLILEMVSYCFLVYMEDVAFRFHFTLCSKNKQKRQTVSFKSNSEAIKRCLSVSRSKRNI